MMIQKIMAHKTRIGLLAFIIGLIVAFVALYIDAIRGDTSGTIGLYQVVGCLIGYTISAIGMIVVVKQADVERSIQTTLFVGGGIVFAISIFSDHIGIAGPAGFDQFQTIAGVLVCSSLEADSSYIIVIQVLNSVMIPACHQAISWN